MFWDKYDPYMFVRVSRDVDDSDIDVFPDMRTLQICWNKTCYYNFTKVDEDSVISPIAIEKCFYIKCYTMVVNPKKYEIFLI